MAGQKIYIMSPSIDDSVNQLPFLRHFVNKQQASLQGLYAAKGEATCQWFT